jgi:hypothetical protein
MYVNAKMISVEATPGVRGGGMRESSGERYLSMIYVIHFKNLCKCMYPHPAQ